MSADIASQDALAGRALQLKFDYRDGAGGRRLDVVFAKMLTPAEYAVETAAQSGMREVLDRNLAVIDRRYEINVEVLAEYESSFIIFRLPCSQVDFTGIDQLRHSRLRIDGPLAALRTLIGGLGQ